MAKLKLEDGTEIEAFTADELKAEIDRETGGLKAKLDELLGETKTAKQKAKELEDAKAAAEEAQAKERGEFKELYERTSREKQELANQFTDFQQRIQKQEITLQVSSLAGELTRDTGRAELLAKEAAQFAKHTESGIKFELGGIEVDRAKIAEHLKAKYPFLVDGSGNSGGGAAGGSSGGAVKKFEEYTGQELSAIRKSDPALYDRLHDAYKNR